MRSRCVPPAGRETVPPVPMTIGSTTGGMVLYTACSMGKQPACMLFSQPIDSLAASGAILVSPKQGG